MSVQYSYDFSFVQIIPECCHVPFMMLHKQYENRINDHKTWYCPNCGSNRYFIDETEEEKLKKQLEAEQRANKFLRKQNEAERNRTRAQKAAKTRLKNRIKNGVCPCCNRHFKNLHRHMENQHPEYVEGEKK